MYALASFQCLFLTAASVLSLQIHTGPCFISPSSMTTTSSSIKLRRSTCRRLSLPDVNDRAVVEDVDKGQMLAASRHGKGGKWLVPGHRRSSRLSSPWELYGGPEGRCLESSLSGNPDGGSGYEEDSASEDSTPRHLGLDRRDQRASSRIPRLIPRLASPIQAATLFSSATSQTEAARLINEPDFAEGNMPEYTEGLSCIKAVTHTTRNEAPLPNLGLDLLAGPARAVAAPVAALPRHLAVLSPAVTREMRVDLTRAAQRGKAADVPRSDQLRLSHTNRAAHRLKRTSVTLEEAVPTACLAMSLSDNDTSLRGLERDIGEEEEDYSSDLFSEEDACGNFASGQRQQRDSRRSRYRQGVAAAAAARLAARRAALASGKGSENVVAILDPASLQRVVLPEPDVLRGEILRRGPGGLSLGLSNASLHATSAPGITSAVAARSVRGLTANSALVQAACCRQVKPSRGLLE